MNYYQHHIGDFNNATRHLSRTERSIYRDLIDLYYDSEKPLTSDFEKLARKILVEDGDRGALREVLNEFFVPMEDGYHNDRCDKEIAAYQRMAEGGKLGAVKRWAKASDSPPITPLSPPHAEGNANHEPITNNHKPITIKEESAKAPAYPKPEDVDSQIWQDWKDLRKKKRATVSETVVKGARGQAAIAGMSLNDFLAVWCRRGSQGLEAAWLKPDERRTPQNRHSAGAAAIFDGATHV